MTSSQGVTETSHEYSYRLGGAEADRWYDVLDEFRDANVFQTIAFCRAKNPSARIDQLVVRRGPDVIAAALVRIVPLPLVRTSIAYVLWGPLFHRTDTVRDPQALAYALKVLRHEYVEKQRIGLRISPLLTREDGPEWVPLFREQGYRFVPARVNTHTIVIDLHPPLEQLRRGLDQKWRNCLNRAERNPLVIREGDDPAVFEPFLEVYREMLARKRLGEPGDIRSFQAAQTALPDRFKLRAFVALEDGQPAAGVICSAMGERGVYVFGATGARGMSNKSSYLLQWRAVQWLKEQGCAVYDLHGSNAQANPGVYAFKMGLSGRNGREVGMLGHFDACHGVSMNLVMKTADAANSSYKKLKGVYGRYRGFQG